MTDLRDRARKVVDALRAKPNLLFEVVAQCRSVRILGPWHRTSGEIRVRSDMGGTACVFVDRSSVEGLWRWQSRGASGWADGYKSLEEACEAADGGMRAAEWVLA